MPLHDAVMIIVKSAQLLKIKVQMSSTWAKSVFDYCVLVCYLTCHDYPSSVEGESHGILTLHHQVPNTLRIFTIV